MNHSLEKPDEQYQMLMSRVQGRFSVIEQIKTSGRTDLSAFETAAFHLRKIIEGTAFGCIIACQNGLAKIPRDASGQWNADNIFARLDKRGVLALPNPSILRQPNAEEAKVAKFVVEGLPAKCLTVDEIRKIYRDTHRWLHELNPYVYEPAVFIEQHGEDLIAAVDRVQGMLESHFIGINGESFFCLLRDPNDGQTKVFSASKEKSI